MGSTGVMKIAVVLPGWIGDAVMATPALRALRAHFAGAHIIGVLKPYVAGVFEGGDWFDEQLFSQATFGRTGVLAVARALRCRGVDLAVLFANSFRSALTVSLGGCRRRIGYGRYGRWPLLTDALSPVRDAAGRIIPSPVIDAYNLLAQRAGCPCPSYRMELFTTPSAERAAERIWQLARLTAFAEVICLNPGAAFGAAKHWPVPYFTQLARELAQKRGCGVLVLCGPSERDMARQISREAAHPAVHALADYTLPADPAGPAISVGLTKACVRRCHLLVSTDSGPRHFAAAFGRPVVSLFGPTHIAWTDTHYAAEVHLQKRVECGPCQRRVCPLDHRCMNDLLPAEVFEAACDLLDHQERRALSLKGA
jgi:heptosyltransferase II